MYDSNPYYNPEKMGLEIIGDWSEDLSYEFHIVLAWKDKESGKYYWAEDSGCSCPTPFEDYFTKESLPVLNRQTYPEFERAVKGLGATLQQLQGVRRRLRNS